MKCILLCAGYAVRMYPLTENFPKSLLKINNKTIIDYLIDDLSEKNNITDFIIVSNHKFIKHFKKWKKDRKENIILLDDGSTNNENRMGAVKDIEFAIKKEKINDDIIVLAGDNLIDFSLNEFINYYHFKKTSVIMTYIENDFNKLKKTGVVELSNDDKVVSFEEKPAEPKTHNAVPPFYIFKKDDLSLISKGISAGCKVDSPGMFIEWFASKSELYAWRMTGSRIDVGDIETYNKLR